jgi:hypothetical protein
MPETVRRDLMTITEVVNEYPFTKGQLASLRYLGKGPRYLSPTPKIRLYRREWIDGWLDASERVGTAA